MPHRSIFLTTAVREMFLLQLVSSDPEIYQFEPLSRQSGLVHAVTGRAGGVSRPPFHTLNLGYGVPDDPANVTSNRNTVAGTLGISLSQIVTAKQVHGNACAVVTRVDAGRGAADRATVLAGYDGLVTNEPGVFLWMSFADCVPIIFHDPVKRAVGLAHSGWRGTVVEVAASTVGKLGEQYQSSPADLTAFIGPSIGPCCYEVGEEVWSQFADRWPDSVDTWPREGDRRLLNLWTAIKATLGEAGLRLGNVHCAETCTACNRDRFFSHRGDQGRSGRFATIIGMRDVGATRRVAPTMGPKLDRLSD